MFKYWPTLYSAFLYNKKINKKQNAYCSVDDPRIPRKNPQVVHSYPQVVLYIYIHLISLPQTYLSCRWLYQLLLVTCTESFNGVSVVQHSMSTECSWGHILFTRRWKLTQSLRSLSLAMREVEQYFFKHTKFVTCSTSCSKRCTSKLLSFHLSDCKLYNFQCLFFK